MPTVSDIVRGANGLLYNGIGRVTNPVGTVGTQQHSIWDKAYGTSSGAIANLIVGREGATDEFGTDSTDLSKAVWSEQSVYKRVQQLSNAKTHGFIQAEDTGKLVYFQINPEKLQYSRGINYVDNSSPGMSYPKVQFVGGKSREFQVELFMYDRQLEPCGIIKDFMSWLGEFLTPEVNLDWYTKPRTMLFCYGYFIRKCVLTDLDIEITDMDEAGTPTMATFTLTLKQVGVTY